MKRENILLVDDSPEMLEVLQRQLSALDFFTFKAQNVADAIDILRKDHVDLMITDIQMPGANGMDLVRFTTEHFPKIPILVVTGFPNISDAVTAIRSGVVDYLTKPFTQVELKQSLDKILIKLNSNNPQSKKTEQTQKTPLELTGIIGNSLQLQLINETINRIKNINVTILIQGESGTGKEMIARAIHYSGEKSKAPFIAVNCGGIPENLLESELFGSVKGAFTGSIETRQGFFQAAEGGTIFLDEIGNASLNVQTRLLRVIQEKEITMVGSNKPKKIDVRIIAATNSNLKEMINRGTFREDLYYRLNVVSIDVPPLRNRKEDIPLLMNYFLEKYSNEYRKVKPEISDFIYNIFQRFDWPGNIRELENMIQRCVIMSNKELTPEILPSYLKMDIPQNNFSDTDFKTLKEIEKEYIQKVLQFTHSNKTKAAEILGIDRKTLRQKLEN